MRMTIVGKNAHSGGSECIVFGHFGGNSGAFAPVTPNGDGAPTNGEFSAHGGWMRRDMRPGSGLTAPALVGWTPGADFCRTSGRLVVLSHRWSGLLQINDVGRKYTVDLYSPDTRLALLDVVNEIMIDITA